MERSASTQASGQSVLPLPPAADEPGVSLFQALQRRQTVREISARPLSDQQLSNLLWSACGVNRSNGPFGMTGRTAASASNSQEVDVYVALADGAYRYDASTHHLERVCSRDLRAYALNPGQHGIEVRAPLQLIYVADVDRLEHTPGFKEPGLKQADVQKSYYFVDTGMIAQNVYLYAAAHALAAWFHHCDKPSLARELKLRPTQQVLFAQSVGVPGAQGR